MKDFLENLEDAAEAAYAEMEQPDGKLKCGCGNIFRPEEGETLSPNPWAMPVCQECFDAWCQEQKDAHNV